MTAPLPDPDGCLRCALPRRGHYSRWDRGFGWHPWIEPTGAIRLSRMKARRAARIAAKQPPAPAPPELLYTITVHDALSPILDRLRRKLAALTPEQPAGPAPRDGEKGDT